MTSNRAPRDKQNLRPILVLEMNDERRELLLFSLAEAGYTVQGCASVGVAWNYVAHHSTALVIATEHLCGLDGINCLAALKEHFPELRCVAVVEDIETWGNRSERGIDAFVFKPLDLAELLQVVTDLSGRQERAWSWGWVRQNFKLLLGRGRDWCKKLWLRWHLRRVEHWRERCFREFFFQVHSGAIGPGGALQAWDELENLDQACDNASQGQIDCMALGDGFRLLFEFIATRAKTRCFWSDRRDPQAVSCRDLSRLMKRIRGDLITVDQLRLAPYLRRCAWEKGREDTSYLAVWGQEEHRDTPWGGARAALERKLAFPLGEGKKS